MLSHFNLHKNIWIQISIIIRDFYKTVFKSKFNFYKKLVYWLFECINKFRWILYAFNLLIVKWKNKLKSF